MENTEIKNNMQIRLGSIAKLSFAYVLGDLFRYGATYLLAPIYTRYLSIDEFGVLAITSVIHSVGYAVLSFGLLGAAFRFFFSFETELERKRFYGTIWLFLVIFSGLFTLILDYSGREFFNYIFKQIPFFPYISITIFTTYLRICFELIPFQIFRASEKATLYLRFSSLSVIISVGLQLLMVVVFEQGIVGLLLANLFSAIIMAFIFSIVLVKNVKICFSLPLLRKALGYSIPLIPHVIASWGLSFFVRFILERNASLGQVGIYSFGDLFRQGYQVLVNGIISAIMPVFGRASNSQTEFEVLPRLTTYYTLIVTTIGVMIALFTREVVVIIFPVEYHIAITIVPWLLLGLFMQALYYIPMNAITQTAGKTDGVSTATVVAGVINIGLNIYTIPKYGITAAAINTFVGYAILFILIYFASRKTCPIQYEYQRLLKILLSAGITILVGVSIRPDSILFGIILKTVSVLLFPFMLSVLKFPNPNEKKIIIDTLVSAKAWVKNWRK